jgi:hypothetical protein
MPICSLRAVTLAIIVGVVSVATAMAKRYPPPRDDDYSFHSVCDLYYVTERVPVYRTPSNKGAVLFYMPRNYGVCLVGVLDGWGVFGRIREAAFFRPFWELLAKHDVDYGWIELAYIGRADSAEESCLLSRGTGDEQRFEFPDAKPDDLVSICATSFDTVSARDVIVMFYSRTYAGNTYAHLSPASLNTCVKTCRDDAQCRGFSYATALSRCELKSDGGIAFEGEGSDNSFAGVKLID